MQEISICSLAGGENLESDSAGHALEGISYLIWCGKVMPPHLLDP